jgi:hypothetical protein
VRKKHIIVTGTKKNTETPKLTYNMTSKPWKSTANLRKAINETMISAAVVAIPQFTEKFLKIINNPCPSGCRRRWRLLTSLETKTIIVTKILASTNGNVRNSSLDSSCDALLYVL